MRLDAPDALLERVSKVVAAQTGLYFPPDRFRDLQRGVQNAAHELGFATLEACLHALQRASLSRPQIEILARHLTIGETYFFRDERSFHTIEHQILRPPSGRFALCRTRCAINTSTRVATIVMHSAIR
jgi:chemotaxis protein methyltransferase CheR